MNMGLVVLAIIVIVALAIGVYQVSKDMAAAKSNSPGGGLVTIPYNNTTTAGYTTSLPSPTTSVNNMGSTNNSTTAATTSSASTSASTVASTVASTTAATTTVHSWG